MGGFSARGELVTRAEEILRGRCWRGGRAGERSQQRPYRRTFIGCS